MAAVSSSPSTVAASASAAVTDEATTQSRPPPPPTHILETALQVKDVAASSKFYREVFGVEPSLDTARMSVFPFSHTTLLLFQLGHTADDTTMPDDRGTIPGHGPSQDILDLLLHNQNTNTDTDTDTERSGPPPPPQQHGKGFLKQHFCLAVPSPADVRAWEAWFAAKGVTVTSTVDWPRGGRSVYFEDLDGNVGEVGSRGIWEHY